MVLYVIWLFVISFFFHFGLEGRFFVPILPVAGHCLGLCLFRKMDTGLLVYLIDPKFSDR